MLAYPPDLKNGSFLQVEKSLLRALNKHDGLTKHQLKIAIAIMDKTYGWGKVKDDIAVSQLSEMTGIQENHCSTNLKKMVLMGIITRESGKYAAKIGINKFFRDWQGWDVAWEWWNKDGDNEQSDPEPSESPPPKPDTNLTAEQIECWEWAKLQDYWQDKVATQSDFLKLYLRPNSGVKKQYSDFKSNPAPKYRGKKKPNDFEFQDFDDVPDTGNGDFIDGEFEVVE
jgi:phage replication O-like protein O